MKKIIALAVVLVLTLGVFSACAVQNKIDDVKNKDSITAYRDYYIKYKKSFATWKTTTPKWFAEAVECPY